MGCEIPRGGKDDSKTFGLNNWKNGVSIYRDEETWGLMRIRSLILMLIWTRPVAIPVEMPSRQSIVSTFLEFRGEVQARDPVWEMPAYECHMKL